MIASAAVVGLIALLAACSASESVSLPSVVDVVPTTDPVPDDPAPTGTSPIGDRTPAVVPVADEEVTPRAGCHPGYAGACLPFSSDVDCIGGGNGPEYVAGPIDVIGFDEYDLDPDGDGTAC